MNLLVRSTVVAQRATPSNHPRDGACAQTAWRFCLIIRALVRYSPDGLTI
jgi:hypothetical protein